jgi:hypothetical protein
MGIRGTGSCGGGDHGERMVAQNVVVGRLTRRSAEILLAEGERTPPGPFVMKAIVKGTCTPQLGSHRHLFCILPAAPPPQSPQRTHVPDSGNTNKRSAATAPPHTMQTP